MVYDEAGHKIRGLISAGFTFSWVLGQDEIQGPHAA